ncbi:MAG: hypothetical protein AUJ56_06190 [Zetaproteobacteria bacterium CG1_02_49_23]|nr:MAG: hypothetical protein AUJ56_06190 [Zetaproteobacteria bacterium CG1_02_49_23]
MNIELFALTLLLTITVVTIAMQYLRRTMRQVIVDLCHSEIGADFWLKSADIMAYSGALMLVLIFNNNDKCVDMVEILRMTLILSLGGVFVTVMFVARNVWKTVSPRIGEIQ